jgi:hypothetical protein
MEDVLARNLTQHYGVGRGIVMVAGNADTLKRVKWTLMMLRKYGCGLPVQVVSPGCVRLADANKTVSFPVRSSGR